MIHNLAHFEHDEMRLIEDELGIKHDNVADDAEGVPAVALEMCAASQDCTEFEQAMSLVCLMQKIIIDLVVDNAIGCY